MIRLIEALRYRSLRYVRQEIGDFHILVGPNASGKSTFLDVIHILGDFLKSGVDRAVRIRTGVTGSAQMAGPTASGGALQSRCGGAAVLAECVVMTRDVS